MPGKDFCDQFQHQRAEKSFEKRMREQVQGSRQPSTYPQRHHHVTQLADCRISQDAFNVRSGNRNRGRQKQQQRAGPRKRAGT